MTPAAVIAELRRIAAEARAHGLTVIDLAAVERVLAKGERKSG